MKLTAPDLLKIGQLYLDGGRWKGRQLVSESWVSEPTSNPLSAEQGNGDPVGYFWSIIATEDARLRGRRQLVSRIFVIPARRLVIVVTADDSHYSQALVEKDFDPVLVKTVIGPL